MSMEVIILSDEEEDEPCASSRSGSKKLKQSTLDCFLNSPPKQKILMPPTSPLLSRRNSSQSQPLSNQQVDIVDLCDLTSSPSTPESDPMPIEIKSLKQLGKSISELQLPPLFLNNSSTANASNSAPSDSKSSASNDIPIVFQTTIKPPKVFSTGVSGKSASSEATPNSLANVVAPVEQAKVHTKHAPVMTKQTIKNELLSADKNQKKNIAYFLVRNEHQINAETKRTPYEQMTSSPPSISFFDNVESSKLVLLQNAKVTKSTSKVHTKATTVKHDPHYAEENAFSEYKFFIDLKHNTREPDEKTLDFNPYLGDDVMLNPEDEDATSALFDTKRAAVLCPLDVQKVSNLILEHNKTDEVMSLIAQVYNTKQQYIAEEFQEHIHGLEVAAQEAPFTVLNAMNTLSFCWCHKCCVFECPIHSLDLPGEDFTRKRIDIRMNKADTTAKTAVTSLFAKKNEKTKGKACGSKCYKEEKSDDIDVQWTENEKNLFLCAVRIWKQDVCRVARAIRTKTCQEVYAFMKSLKGKTSNTRLLYNVTPKEDVTQKEVKVMTWTKVEKKAKKKKKEAESGDEEQEQWSHIYPVPETEIVDVDLKSHHHGPCYCEGKCGKSCPCASGGNLCTYWCKCPESCQRRFKGCQCLGTCDTNKCPCFKARRECDPSLCKGHHHGNGKKPCACQNMNIQINKEMPLMITKSKVHGWGALALTNIKQGQYIVEYRGEVISQAEAERRGVFYDKRNLSYLFNLTNETVVDGYRKGNISRFFNHADKPNCECRIMYVLGDYHIGIYASRNIEKGEELFFNYGKRFIQESVAKRKEQDKEDDKEK